MLAGEILHQTFGAALAKLYPAVVAVLSQRLSLLCMGMEVEKFYPKRYGKGVKLGDALGDASDDVIMMQRKTHDESERVHLGQKFEQMQQQAMLGGVGQFSMEES